MATKTRTPSRSRKESAKQKRNPPRASPGRAAPGPGPRRKTKSAVPHKAGPEPRIQPETGAAGFTFHVNPTLTLICVPDNTPARFSLEAAASLTDVHPDLFRYYWRAGLIENLPGQAEAGLFFGAGALQEVRRIEHYRRHLDVNRRALPLICELRREADRQQVEIQFLRYP